MKTIIYNLQKGIITTILVLIISTVGSAATKTHETSNTTNHNMAEAITANHEASSTAGPAIEANERELSYQIEDWMSNGSYWEADNSSAMTEKDLAAEIESWMSDGSYWNQSNQMHKADGKITHKIKSWMSNGSFWGTDNGLEQPE
jgi:hypothetical protein